MYILVGGFNPSEKYFIVSWDDYSQYMEKLTAPTFYFCKSFSQALELSPEPS